MGNTKIFDILFLPNNILVFLIASLLVCAWLVVYYRLIIVRVIDYDGYICLFIFSLDVYFYVPLKSVKSVYPNRYGKFYQSTQSIHNPSCFQLIIAFFNEWE